MESTAQTGPLWPQHCTDWENVPSRAFHTMMRLSHPPDTNSVSGPQSSLCTHCTVLPSLCGHSEQ
uniref:Uncharacterized protein n=1 Tax=Anguilla anguilla TaxID=7936 RepID=A0A0E9R583_ANGAN